jgi:hypothetical protein
MIEPLSMIAFKTGERYLYKKNGQVYVGDGVVMSERGPKMLFVAADGRQVNCLAHEFFDGRFEWLGDTPGTKKGVLRSTDNPARSRKDG